MPSTATPIVAPERVRATSARATGGRLACASGTSRTWTNEPLRLPALLQLFPPLRRLPLSERQRLNDDYRAYQDREIEAHLASLTPRALQDLLAQAKDELFTEHENLRLMNETHINRVVRSKAASIVRHQMRFMSFTAFCASEKDRR